MGSPYQSQSASSYNSSPPADDGSTVASNKITWAGIKTKLADSIKTLADAINTQLRTSLNVTPSSTSVAYTTLVGDHLTTIETTSGAAVHLGDAATMIAQTMGYTVSVYNKSTSSSATVDLATNTNTLAGQTNGTVTLPPGAAMTFTVANSGLGYDIISSSGFAPVSLSGVAGTNTVTAAAPANLIALFSGLKVFVTPAVTNTAATTLNITPSGGSALTAKNVFAWGAACAGGELVAGTVYEFVYDGTQFNIINPSAPTLTNSLGGDVSANNTANYFTGPTVAQGTVGKWLATGKVTVRDNAGGAQFYAKLWDGTTVGDSGNITTSTVNAAGVIALSAVFTSPAGNITISVRDPTSTSGKIAFNETGNSKDSTLTVVRIG